MKNLGFILLGLVVVLFMGGCNTIRGIGKDMSTVGGWVVKGADNVEQK